MNSLFVVPMKASWKASTKIFLSFESIYAIPDLVVKDLRLGKDTNTKVTYIYIESIADKDVVRDG